MMIFGRIVMLQEERFDRILSEVSSKGAVKVAELADLMSTSESTIRRDINELDAAGKLRKVFGGAVPIDKGILTVDADVRIKSQKQIKEKEEIARYAASLIEDYDVVFLDAGTTTERMIDFLNNRTVVYVTNSVANVQKLAQRGFTAYVTGGTLKLHTQALVGPAAMNFINDFNFTKCFVGANGIDINRGYTTPNMDEAAIKRVVIQNSQNVYIIADSTKFGLISAVTFSPIEKAEIITDTLPDRNILKYTSVVEAGR